MLRRRSVRFFATTMLSSVVMLVLLSGCGNSKKSKGPVHTNSIKRVAPARTSKKSLVGQLPLQASSLTRKATSLSRAFKKNPENSKVALNYIHHLRALGMHQRAVSILHQAYQANPKHPVIASEYGRLLLGSGKSTQARRVLDRIEGKGKPDWRTLSALGTLEARDGNYAKATEYFTQARVLAPKKASILNNLALSTALGGKPDEAENMLRNADDSGRFGARLRQNLALVLALQGKYDEAQAMATTDLPSEQAKKNIAYLKNMLATSDSHDGIELTDETITPVANRLAGNMDDGPTTTATIAVPTKIVPEAQKVQDKK